MTVGHEAFWSTVAQLLVVVGGISAVAFSKALAALPGGPELTAVLQRLAVLVLGAVIVVGYLVLEAIALLVLAGEATQSADLRTQAVAWLLSLTIVSLLGPGYFLGYAQSARRAAATAELVSGATHRAFRRAALMPRLRARRKD